jgi:cytochrome c-type biogenesis protein CcmH/NrfG
MIRMAPKAREMLLKALELRKDDPETLAHLGALASMQG